MTLSENVMRHLHRAHLKTSIPKLDLLTWAFVLSSFDPGFVRVSSVDHIHDKIYGANDVVEYLNRLHIGLFAMRASFARHLGFEGSPLDLARPDVAIKYFAIHLGAQYPLVRDAPQCIEWVRHGCLVPDDLDVVRFSDERAKVARMQLVLT